MVSCNRDCRFSVLSSLRADQSNDLSKPLKHRLFSCVMPWSSDFDRLRFHDDRDQKNPVASRLSSHRVRIWCSFVLDQYAGQHSRRTGSCVQYLSLVKQAARGQRRTSPIEQPRLHQNKLAGKACGR